MEHCIIGICIKEGPSQRRPSQRLSHQPLVIHFSCFGSLNRWENNSARVLGVCKKCPDAKMNDMVSALAGTEKATMVQDLLFVDNPSGLSSERLLLRGPWDWL